MSQPLTPSIEDRFASAATSEAFISGYIDYLCQVLQAVDTSVIDQIIVALREAREAGKTVFVYGNGGSAATASHMANDLGVGTRHPGKPGFKIISLPDQLAPVSAIANDFGYEHIFKKQLEPLLSQGDVAIALSVSGNSPNVLLATEYAKSQGALTIGCTGFDGGELAGMVDINLHVPTHRGEYGPVEDVFQILDHILYSYFKAAG